VFLRCILWVDSATAVVVIVCWLVSIARCTWIGVIVSIACAVIAVSIIIIITIVVVVIPWHL